ncbi:MAG: hypothetical protein KBC91_05005, partial [Candidatus Omnitrophica bacterium]|nr:hypothetical protein [Candidatus Omnitrophota bacterium]
MSKNRALAAFIKVRDDNMKFLSGFGDYRFLAASSYLTSAVCMMLAVLIITANLKSQRCRLAGLFNLNVSLWAFFYSGSLLWGGGDAGTWAAKLLTSFALFLSCFYTHLVVLLRQKTQAAQKIIILNYIYAVGVAVWILVSRDVVDGARSKIDLPSYAHAGSFYFLVPIHT